MTKFERFLMFFNIDSNPTMMNDLYAQSEMTRTYTVLLLLANFIALFGLITNSVAVIIGAMLISPLMGPIISFGFAYITSEEKLMRLSMETILKSIAYVVLSAAFLSYISPLNDLNEQILARTKPNLYDLFIAVFSGLVVAVSFLSKKANAVSILTGVAIATSIIPPLSVVGFGIGTGNWEVSLGSFLLFFTNFAAIVATTALSGILFGYNYFHNLKDFGYIKKRLIMILVIIAAVSFPLSYTLKQSIESIKIRRVVNSAVSEIKDATVFNISYKIDGNHKLNLQIALASGKPVTKEELAALKAGIESRLDLKTDITVTQVALKEDVLNNRTAIVSAKQQEKPESVSSAAINLRDMTDAVAERTAPLISPYPVTSYGLTINSDKTAVMVFNVRKDSEFSQAETDMISNFIDAEYKFRTAVQLRVSPLFEPVEPVSSDGKLPAQMQDFSLITAILSKNPEAKVYITESGTPRPSGEILKKYLIEKYGIGEEFFTVTYAETAENPYLTVTVK